MAKRDEPYDILRQSVSEASQGRNLSPARQDYLAGKLHNAYQSVFDAFLQRHPGSETTFNQAFGAGNYLSQASSSVAAELHQQALNTPIDFSEYYRAFGVQVDNPILMGSQVRDALFQSQQGDIFEIARKASNGGMDFSTALQYARTGWMENYWQYNPNQSKASFSFFSHQAAFAGSKEGFRYERQTASLGGQSLLSTDMMNPTLSMSGGVINETEPWSQPMDLGGDYARPVNPLQNGMTSDQLSATMDKLRLGGIVALNQQEIADVADYMENGGSFMFGGQKIQNQFTPQPSRDGATPRPFDWARNIATVLEQAFPGTSSFPAGFYQRKYSSDTFLPQYTTNPGQDLTNFYQQKSLTPQNIRQFADWMEAGPRSGQGVDLTRSAINQLGSMLGNMSLVGSEGMQMSNLGEFDDQIASIGGNQHSTYDDDLGFRSNDLGPSAARYQLPGIGSPIANARDRRQAQMDLLGYAPQRRRSQGAQIPNTLNAQNELLDSLYTSAVASGDVSGMQSAHIGDALLAGGKSIRSGMTPEEQDQSTADYKILQGVRSREARARLGSGHALSPQLFGNSDPTVPMPEDAPDYGGRAVPVGQRGTGPAQRFMRPMDDPILGTDRFAGNPARFMDTGDTPLRVARRSDAPPGMGGANNGEPPDWIPSDADAPEEGDPNGDDPGLPGPSYDPETPLGQWFAGVQPSGRANPRRTMVDRLHAAVNGPSGTGMMSWKVDLANGAVTPQHKLREAAYRQLAGEEGFDIGAGRLTANRGGQTGYVTAPISQRADPNVLMLGPGTPARQTESNTPNYSAGNFVRSFDTDERYQVYVRNGGTGSRQDYSAYIQGMYTTISQSGSGSNISEEETYNAAVSTTMNTIRNGADVGQVVGGGSQPGQTPGGVGGGTIPPNNGRTPPGATPGGVGNTPNSARGFSWEEATRPNASHLGMYSDAVYGTASHSVDEQGNEHWRIAQRGGNVTITEGMIGKAAQIASSAGQSAVSAGHMPDNPEDAIATVRQRIYASIEESTKAEVDRMVGGGNNPVDAKNVGEAIKSVANHLINGAVKGIAGTDEFGGTAGVTYSNSGDIKTNSVRISTPEMAQSVAANNPRIVERLSRMGLTPEEAAKLPADEAVVMNATDENGEPTGESFSFGQSPYGNNGSGSSRGNGRGNLWGRMGAAGSFMYGAYIIGREWRMAMGQATASEQAYVKWAGGNATLGEYGGGGMIASPEGQMAREELTQINMGQGAQQAFGGFSDLAYGFSGNPAYARVSSEVGGVAGVSAATLIGGSMASMMAAGGATALAPVAAAAPWVAAGIAGAGLVSMAGFEIYGALNPNEPTPTFGSVVKNTVNNKTYSDAKTAYLNDLAKKQGSNGQYVVSGSGPIAGFQSPFLGMAPDQKQKASDEFDNNAQIQAQYLSKEDMRQMGLGYLPTNYQFINASVAAAQAWTGDQGTAASSVASAQQMFGGYVQDQVDKNGNVIPGTGNGVAYNEDIAKAAVNMGLKPSDLEGRAAQYASNMGYVPGTHEFRVAANNYMGVTPSFENIPEMLEYNQGNTSETALSQKDYQAQRNAQLGSQLQYYMTNQGQGAQLVNQYNLSAPQVSSVSGLAQSQMQFGYTPNWNSLAGMSQSNNSYVSSMIASTSQVAGIGGFNVPAFQSAVSGAGMSNQSAYLFDQMMNGNVGAFSYNAWTTGSMANRWMDMSGQSTSQFNGASFSITSQLYYRQLQSQAAAGDKGAQATLSSGTLNWANNTGGSATAAAMLGTNNPDIVNAYQSGGMANLQKLGNQYSYEASMASAGNQVAGVRLQQAYDWGTGSWSNPSPGSSWGLENQQIGMQQQSQETDFAVQQQRMQLSNQYSIAQEQNQYHRMNTSQQYNSWQMDFSYQNNLQQRGWTQQSWNYNSQMNSMQFGWNMQDINEAIRFSSGRQRQDLINQRDRAATTYNLQTEQTTTQESEQKQVWAEQDEQYQKSKTYQKELNDLDLQSYNLNKSQRETLFKLDEDEWARKKKEYEDEQKIEDEMRQLQRKYASDQLDLQLAAAGAQAYYASKQKELNDALVTGETNIGNITGNLNNLNTYDKAFLTIQALTSMGLTFNQLDTNKVNAVTTFLKQLNNTNVRLAVPD